MLLYLSLGLAILIALILAVRWYVSVEPKELVKALKWLVFGIIVAGLVLLAFSGRLLVALAAMPAMLAWFMRLYTGLKYAQMFTRMMGGKGPNGNSDQANPARSSSQMNADEALKILGLSPGASADEIKAAHRRLLANVHPDVGGSNYLAQQINLAKDVLLNK